MLQIDKIVAMNVDAYNRDAKATVDLVNGSIFQLASKSEVKGEEDIWLATAPASGALTNLWMAYTPEEVITASGTLQFKNIVVDPQHFTNIAGKVLAAFKPQVGDVITLTAASIGGEIGLNGYVVATNGEYKLQWAAAAVTGLSLKLIKAKYITVASGSTIGAIQRITAYEFEVVAI